MRLSKIIMVNTAPFKKLILDFGSENISVLSGVNGTGKTTILSYIVDAFYELARKAFFNEFEDKSNKFYRVSSNLYAFDKLRPSVVYMRFLDNAKRIDYVDIRGECSEEEYLSMIQLDDPIPFSSLESALRDRAFIKYWSLSNTKEIREKFNQEILTYFPAYRYETPHYLNDPYKVELKFKIDMNFSGYLTNPIEVTSDLQQIANWCMDIVLDFRTNDASASSTLEQLNVLLSNILHFKLKLPEQRFIKYNICVHLGIGRRNKGAARLSITDAKGNVIYPSIFNMSSGELALLCLFGELIRQSDKLGSTSENIHGIVLVDEIDKHLHVTLQKEILPKLIAMFPNIQFIVSSHSPFLGLGLADKDDLSHQIFDLDNEGMPCSPNDNEIFREAYGVFIREHENFAALYRQLQEQLHESTKPILITEGKTDWKHLEAAMKALNITNIDICFHEFEYDLGDVGLLAMLKNLCRISSNRKVIGIFDRDNFNVLRKNDKDFANRLNNEKYIDMGNNVYAFAIPVVHEDIYGPHISIEHYYMKEHLTKMTPEGLRLFLGSEFFEKVSLKIRAAPIIRTAIVFSIKWKSTASLIKKSIMILTGRRSTLLHSQKMLLPK